MSTLTLLLANRIIEGALKRARERALNPMAVVVLDTAGEVKALQREDEAHTFRIDVALGKAWAAGAMGESSRIVLQNARENPPFYNAMAATAGGKFLPQTGAALIRDAKGKVLGSAGASGGAGEEDEAICLAGIAAAGLESDPVG